MLDFMVASVGALLMDIKRNPIWKKWLTVVGVCFVLIIGGVLSATLSSTIHANKTNIAMVRTNADPLLASKLAYNLGLIYLKNCDYENAIEAFKDVATNDPNYAEVQSKTQEAKNFETEQLLANAKNHIANNEFDEALIRLNKALTLNPNLTEASNLIQIIQQKQQAYLERVEQ
jgi:tetratricopeptide (TPR) repeat protein